jgi:hypothetical protein
MAGIRLCLLIRNCQVVSYFNHKGVLVSAGVCERPDGKFITFCVQDPWAGCQHIITRSAGAFLLIELITRALRLLADQS